MARFTALCAGILALATFAAPANAQATRTWVSGVGDDVNPCSRTAPCKTFAGAISKTAAGGEISVLDPAGFGAVTITKSISIVAEGSQGSVLGSMTSGVIINAGPNDTVLLHGLFIEGAGNGTNGVRVINAGQVHIRNVVIRGFRADGAGNGVLVEPSANVRVVISDTAIEANTTGILVKTSTTPGAAAPSAKVLLNGVEAIHNTGSGVLADGAGASIQLNGSTVAQNGFGLTNRNGGQIASFGNNTITGNTQDGAPTAKLQLQ